METNDKTTPITPEKDRNTISMDLMHRMRLHGMAVAFTSANRFQTTMLSDETIAMAQEIDFILENQLSKDDIIYACP